MHALRDPHPGWETKAYEEVEQHHFATRVVGEAYARQMMDAGSSPLDALMGLKVFVGEADAQIAEVSEKLRRAREARWAGRRKRRVNKPKKKAGAAAT